MRPPRTKVAAQSLAGPEPSKGEAAPEEPNRSVLGRFGPPALIVLATTVAYARCFTVPFLFDDKPAIIESNPTIRHLWPIWPALFPPITNGQTVGGRPLPNLTLAVNYAISGLHPWSYHVFNLAVHLASALVLYGLIRWSALCPTRCSNREQVRTTPFATDTVFAGPQRGPASALGTTRSTFALGAALLWAVHPLQTEAVTYVIQRVESLMALCYLLCLYCFARSIASPNPRRWRIATVAICLVGMACKEVMATAPLMVLLFDRTFVSGSLAEAWRRHRALYLGLAATWLLVIALAIGTHGRGGTAGFPLGGNWESHILTQIYALAHYLRLAVWPYPLVFDYGYFQVHNGWSVVPQAVLLLALAAAVVVGTIRNRLWAFLGAGFFIVLSPSTLVPIPVQTMAEHRIYLPLAALAIGAAWVIWMYAGRWAGAMLAVAVLALGAATYARNLDYQSDFSIWQSAALHHPAGSARASFNYANLLAGRGRKDDALAQLNHAIEIEPRFAAAYDNLGTLLLSMGQPDRALAAYDRSMELDPKLVDPRFHSGLMLEQLGRPREAESRLRSVLELDPKRTDARLELGNALFRSGRSDEALAQYQEAMRTSEISAEAYNNIGTIWFDRRNFPAAIDCYRHALRLGPDSPDTRLNLGNALAVTGQFAQAAEEYRAVLRLNPQDAQARENLAKVEAALSAR